MHSFLRWYLVAVAIALFGAFMAQTFLPAVGGHGTGWGLSPGWQREIGFWNVALIVIIVGEILNGDRTSARLVTVGIIVMGVLFGTNHLIGYVSGMKSALHVYGEDGGTLWHMYGTVANYLAVVLGAHGLRASKEC